MGIFRAIWSIILATLVAAIIGAMFDYLRPQFFGEGMDYKFLYPWVTGVAGLFAALIAVGLTGGLYLRRSPLQRQGCWRRSLNLI